MKFHGNPSSGSRAFPCGRTDRQMLTLTVVFSNFAKTPKTYLLETLKHQIIYDLHEEVFARNEKKDSFLNSFVNRGTKCQ